MGGPGSGNHDYRGVRKTTVEECLSIDAGRWRREGVLVAGARQVGSWRWTYPGGRGFSVNYEVNTLGLSGPWVRLWYSWVWTSTQQEESADYTVGLTATRPRFGGLRWWFVCPLVVGGRHCQRRVGKLYLPPSSRYFGCRRCHRLTYTSCQESHKHDRLHRLIARNMGCDPSSVKEVMKRFGKRR
jgi:hypothetical protein